MPIPLLAFFVHFARTLWALVRDPSTRNIVVLVLILIGVGAWVYHLLEGWSYLDSVYFAVITLSTIGYGDFSPQTDAGKLFTIAYILVGLGVLATFISLIAQKQRETLVDRPGRKLRRDVEQVKDEMVSSVQDLMADDEAK